MGQRKRRTLAEEVDLIPTTRLAWKTNLRLVGWNPAIGSALAVVLGLVLTNSLWETSGFTSLTLRVVETIVPLVAGLQAAFLLSPEDEAPLELILSCPRPLALVLLDRLVMLMILQGSVALTGNLVVLLLHGNEGWLITIARWFAPSLCLSGVALFTTQLTRQGSFGALLATLMWGGMLFGGDGLLRRWPSLWPLHVFLQPDRVDLIVYMLNRTALITIGAFLVVLALYLSRDEERMMIGRAGGVRAAA
jgi:hypothetical protein